MALFSLYLCSLPSVCDCVPISPYYKGTSQAGLEPTHMTLLILFFKAWSPNTATLWAPGGSGLLTLGFSVGQGEGEHSSAYNRGAFLIGSEWELDFRLDRKRRQGPGYVLPLRSCLTRRLWWQDGIYCSKVYSGCIRDKVCACVYVCTHLWGI